MSFHKTKKGVSAWWEAKVLLRQCIGRARYGEWKPSCEEVSKMRDGKSVRRFILSYVLRELPYTVSTLSLHFFTFFTLSYSSSIFCNTFFNTHNSKIFLKFFTLLYTFIYLLTFYYNFFILINICVSWSADFRSPIEKNSCRVRISIS